MSTVILVLGLIAAGIYTSNGWFYVLAGVAGFISLFVQLLIAGFVASVGQQVKKDVTKRRRM